MINDSTLVQLLVLYKFPGIFLGAFFFGETVILSAAFLSAQGLWSPWAVFLIALIATIVSDSLWFSLGLYILKLMKRWQKYEKKYDKFLHYINKLTGNKPFLSLLFIKFLYGTRILMIVYLSLRKLRFLLFVLFDTLGTIIWLLVMISLGYLAGLGVANILPWIGKIEYVIAILVILLIIYKALTLWVSKKLIKE